MDVENSELRTTREVAREIGGLLDALESGALEKVVVVQQGRMRAVILSATDFERLVSTTSEGPCS